VHAPHYVAVDLSSSATHEPTRVLFMARLGVYKPGFGMHGLGFKVHRLGCVVHGLELEDIPGLLDGDSVIELARHATVRLPGFRPMHQQQVQVLTTQVFDALFTGRPTGQPTGLHNSEVVSGF